MNLSVLKPLKYTSVAWVFFDSLFFNFTSNLLEQLVVRLYQSSSSLHTFELSSPGKESPIYENALLVLSLVLKSQGVLKSIKWGEKIIFLV